MTYRIQFVDFVDYLCAVGCVYVAVCLKLATGCKAPVSVQHTRRAMTNVGIPEDEQNAVFQLVATVLHLGNLDFEDAGEHDSSKLAESAAEALQAAARLLGTSAEGLARALTTRTRQTVDGMASVHMCSKSVSSTWCLTMATLWWSWVSIRYGSADSG